MMLHERKSQHVDEEEECPNSSVIGHLSFAKTPSGGQMFDLSALIRRRSRLDDHPPAPHASPPPVPLRRPPPPRPLEPRLAPATRRLQANGDPAETTHD